MDDYIPEGSSISAYESRGWRLGVRLVAADVDIAWSALMSPSSHATDNYANRNKTLYEVILKKISHPLQGDKFHLDVQQYLYVHVYTIERPQPCWMILALCRIFLFLVIGFFTEVFVK